MRCHLERAACRKRSKTAVHIHHQSNLLATPTSKVCLVEYCNHVHRRTSKDNRARSRQVISNRTNELRSRAHFVRRSSGYHWALPERTTSRNSLSSRPGLCNQSIAPIEHDRVLVFEHVKSRASQPRAIGEVSGAVPSRTCSVQEEKQVAVHIHHQSNLLATPTSKVCLVEHCNRVHRRTKCIA